MFLRALLLLLSITISTTVHAANWQQAERLDCEFRAAIQKFRCRYKTSTDKYIFQENFDAMGPMTLWYDMDTGEISLEVPKELK